YNQRFDTSQWSVASTHWLFEAGLLPPPVRAHTPAHRLSSTTKPRAMRRLRASAINPMTGGPTIKPTYPQVATAAIAVPAACFEVRPAALSVRGNTTENPAPTRPKPRRAIGIQVTTSASVSSMAATMPPSDIVGP